MAALKHQRRLCLALFLSAWAFFTPASSGLASRAIAQDSPDPLTLVASGNYLKAWQAASATALMSPPPEWAAYNLQLMDSFVKGTLPAYRAPSDDRVDCGKFARAARKLPSSQRDPLKMIASAAAKARVVILNENHFEPRHRAFALQLALALKPIGYDAIGVEALDNLDEVASAAQNRFSLFKGPVNLDSGILTSEPSFARFLNLSEASGYRLVAYEYPGADAGVKSIREEAQAVALKKYLDAHPHSKIMIYVGYSHVAERPLIGGDGYAEVWMAARLRSMLATDIVTIDQTFDGYAACARTSRNTERGTDRIDRAPYVIAKGGGFGRYGNVVDFQVLHKPELPVNGRPAWMTSLQLTPAPAKVPVSDDSAFALIQVFALPRSAKAVPVDQILLLRGEKMPDLMTPRGPYQVVRLTK